MKLYHHSQDILEQVNPCSYIQNLHTKPHGLWLSCETGIEGDISWQEWCKMEEYRFDRLKYKHKVKLKPNTKLITIKDKASLIQFTNKYIKRPIKTLTSNLYIDWITISKSYQGIMIYPIQSNSRHDPRLSWYNSWDCASGCIWDTNTIKSIKLVEEITNIKIGGTPITYDEIMTTFRELSYTGKQTLMELTKRGTNTQDIVIQMKKEIKDIEHKAKEKK